jgi:hypothetical protein
MILCLVILAGNGYVQHRQAELLNSVVKYKKEVFS